MPASGKGSRSKGRDGNDVDEDQHGQAGADERTPLLQQQEQGNEDEGDNDSNDGQDSIVEDLGDFTVQPKDLSQAIGDKDTEKFLSLCKAKDGEDNAVEAVMQAFQSDAKKGLASDQTSEEGRAERVRVYGKNKLPEKQLKPFWRFLWEAFNDKVLIILTVAAAVSFALGMYQDFGPQHDPDEPRVQWVEGVAIMAAITIVTLTSSVNDYSKERQFKALNDTKEIPNVKVLRDGKKYKVIKATEVMVGDIVHIEAGDILQCDGVVLEMKDQLKVDESDATGESDAISKKALNETGNKRSNEGQSKDASDENGDDEESDAFLLSGSKILEGSGNYLVLAVGTSSFQGRIFMSLRSSQPDQTRMQKQLAELAEKIAKLASIAGGILFVALFVRGLVQLKTDPDRTAPQKVQGFLQSFVIAITLIVVAVPEGLPLAVTLALAFATNRMTSHNLLVRVFEACETMSNANVVVTDKTGTLTANEMRVVEGTIAGTMFSARPRQSEEDGGEHGPEDDEVDAQGLMELLRKNETVQNVLMESIAINSTAFEEHAEESKDGESKQNGKDSKAKKSSSDDSRDKQDEGPKFVGNKTESALLRFMAVDLSDLELEHYASIRERAETVLLLPFSSDRKAMATVVKKPDGDGYRMYIKGAAEVISGLCTTRAVLAEPDNKEGDDVSSDEKKKDIQDLVEKYAKRALRTIALAYKDFESWPPEGVESTGSGKDAKVKYEDLAKDLVLLAIPGIEDPLREGVKDAVEKCHRAGVKVKMCTGDNALTAQAIAKQCAIYSEKKGEDGEHIVITGSEWRELSSEEQVEKAPKISVMARSLPQDKEQLVKALQSAGEIVGVTGDGTNDALALKVGDVGFSMGQAGTEVAKEASDVIIMDDNFTSLVGAIAWGRCVSDAVRKFLQFQLAVNATAIVITFVSAVTGGDENAVLNAVQLLWVNLIMDTFAALALATDPADDSLLDRKPEKRDAPIISVTMTKMIVVQAAYQITITLALHFIGPGALRPITGRAASSLEFDTLVFNIFVWCQIFNMINCRALDNSFNVFAGLHRNFWMLGILAIMIGGQVLIVFVGGAAFGTTPISPTYWAISIAFGAGSLVVGALVRLIPDAPLGQLLIWLRLMPNSDDLPRTRPKKDTKPLLQGSEVEHNATRFIEKIRGGRSRASRLSKDWLFKGGESAPSDSKDVLKGLVMIPALGAQAIAGTREAQRDQSD